MALNISNTPLFELRKAWARDWAQLVKASEYSGGEIRHLYDDRPEGFDPQRWEALCRRDYANIADWYGFPPLETDPVVQA